MKVVLASDHAGFLLKEYIKSFLTEKEILYQDFGTCDETPVDYPDLAYMAARSVHKGDYEKGMIFCGTGNGVAITANKLKGIRAALCCDNFSARCARAHNDANILTLGARIIDREIALEIVDIFLKTTFEGGRHHRRIEKISKYEDKSHE